MNATSATNKLLRRLLVGAVIAATAVGTIAAQPVSAWQHEQTSGSVGAVVAPTVYFGDVYQAGSKYFTAFSSTGPIVYRSAAAAGVQTVRVVYTVERWNGSGWQTSATSSVVTGRIEAWQQGVRITTGASLMPSTSTGYFRLRVVVGWYSGTTVLATTFVTPTAAIDQFCTTVNPNRSCITYAGYVWVG